MNKKMTLTERLLNPQWVGAPGDRAALDVGQAIKTMAEAAEWIIAIESAIRSADPDDNIGSLTIDLPKNGYPRQYLVNAVKPDGDSGAVTQDKRGNET